MRRFLFAATFIVLTMSLSLSGIVQAQTRSVEARLWDVTIDQIDTTDNTFVVTEVQTLDFTGSFTFGARDISLNNLENIQNLSISVDGERLEEGCSDRAGTYCVTNSLIEKTIRYIFPEPVTDDSVSVEIIYTVVGALRVYEGGDQLFWQAIPQRHSYRVEESKVTVIFPEGYAPRQGIDPIVSEGAPSEFTVTETTVNLQTMRSVFANEKFSVRIQYPHDPNARMASWQPGVDAEIQFEEVTKPLIQLGLAALAILLLIGGPLLIYSVWSSRGKEAKVMVPTFISEPPVGIHPALAGLLMENTVKTQHILSTLFDLARRGYLKISEDRYSGNSQFSFIKNSEPVVDDTPSYYESHLMQDVFSGGDTRTLESMKESFYRELSSLRRMVTDERVERKLIDQRRTALQASFASFSQMALFLGIALIFFGVSNAQSNNDSVFRSFVINLVLFGVAFLINAFVLRILSGRISPFTQEGVEAREKTAAFRKFLEDREKFRELGYTGENFEKYLPYAIAFGMDREWIQRFQEVKNVSSPSWYVPVYVDTTAYNTYSNTPNTPVDLSGGIFGGGSASSETPSTPNISLDSLSNNLSSSLSGISLGLTDFLNSAASAMTSAPAPTFTVNSSSSSSSSSSWSSDDSSWGGSSSGSSSDSGGWSGGGDSGGGDSGGGGSDFG